MRYIDTHIHMISRSTDDYQNIAMAGCKAVCEPAFWAGWDRSSVESFRDYFRHISEFEPKRAARFDIQHYCWMCINAKEAEDRAMSDAVIEIIPEFLEKETVLGIGEIGLNKNSRNELYTLEKQIDLAAQYDQLILIHTPHLEDKYKGTQLTLDALKNQPKIKPERVIIDHVEEHTVKMALDQGYWAGMTLYPESKFTAPRAVDIWEIYGGERLLANSSGDWGISDPMAVPKMTLEMRKRNHSEQAIEQFVFKNPVNFLSQCPKFKISS